MKHALIIISGFVLMSVLSFIPPYQGRSQDSAIISTRPINKIDSVTIKNIDTINSAIVELNKKLTPPKIVYRTKTIVKYMHDTIYLPVKKVDTVKQPFFKRLFKKI